MTDLLNMSSLNTKTPAVAPGAGDLLDTLVQDHLDRAAPTPDEAAASTSEESALALAGAIEAALAADRTPAAPTESTIVTDPAAPGNDDLLKREIETLLRGNVDSSAPIKHVPAPAPSFSDTSPALPPDEDPAAVSQAELQTLLTEETPAPAAAILPPEPVAPLPDHAQQVTEAEDLLAAELAQLMAEAQPAIASEAARASSSREESLAAPVAELPPKDSREPALTTVATPASSSELPARSPEELDASIQQIMAAAPAIEPAPAVTPPTAAPAPEDTAHDQLPGDIAELETPPAPSKPRGPGLFRRTQNALAGFVLLLAQLLDMPFAWLNDLDKNVIGVIAFLLLLSGCLLYGVSLYYH